MKTSPVTTNKNLIESPKEYSDQIKSENFSDRIELGERLKIESKLVMNDSLEILFEFEKLEDSQ